MRKLLITLLIPVIISCSTDDPVCCTNIDTGISIQYFDLQGQDLLESGVYSESNIEIYHKIDGEWVRYYEGNLDSPKGISVVEHEAGYYLTLFPSSTLDSENVSETKIEFSETDFDIVKAEIDRSNGNEVVTKVWYNDQLRWEAYDTERKFTVIKEDLSN